ncbi:DNA-3-methyladenine glycosylase I, partial [Porcipelethomonas sp.]|uniref:DNA-3-methyladenine glycosylase I n=1 Tax=Porcipelethomonas sp. TaxID=2981675 RepID=UPI00307A8E20
YLWGFTDNRTIIYDSHRDGQLPAKNELSDEISRDLKKRGFKYLGSITVYSHLQACGIINDHEEKCFRYKELTEKNNDINR